MMYIGAFCELFSSASSKEGRLFTTTPMGLITNDLRAIGLGKSPQFQTWSPFSEGEERKRKTKNIMEK